MDDFQFTASLLEGFFAQRKVQNSLVTIWDQDISGWEIWLQVEFATYLSLEHSDSLEWGRECQLLVDRRRNKERTKLAADFIFRRKRHALDRYIVLEFKQNASPKSCFANMMKDIEKIQLAKSSEMDMRGFWVVGVHPKHDMTKAEIKDYLGYQFDIAREDILTVFIPNTNYAFTMF